MTRISAANTFGTMVPGKIKEARGTNPVPNAPKGQPLGKFKRKLQIRTEFLVGGNPNICP